MKRAAVLCLFVTLLAAVGIDRARAHDLPGEVSVSGFFDYAGAEPELVLRVPLIMLTNVNLPKRGPGYLDLAEIEDGVARAEAAVASAFGIVAAGRPLVPRALDSRISLASEDTFDAPDTARVAILGDPLPVSRNVFWNQGYFDVRMVFPAQEDGTGYSLRTDLPPGMADRTIVTLGIIAPDRPMRMLSVAGASGDLALDPEWHQAGSLFLTKGVEHILTGTDHLLFLLLLILPLRADPRRLLGVVTAFTIGHSMTLIPAALGLAPSAAWFLPALETVIAASIVYMAVENLLGASLRFRWKLAFGFGLIHGIGFANTLTDVMQFAGAHLVTSLVFFNIGIELGQVLILAVVVPLLALVLRNARLERSGIVVISVLAGHEAWHWATERARGIDFAVDGGAAIFEALTWTGVALVLGIALWWALASRRRRPGDQPMA